MIIPLTTANARLDARLNRGWKKGCSYGPKRRPLPLTDQWALSDCRYVLWPRPISREGYNPPLVGVIRLGSILHSPYSPSGWLHLRLPCPLTRCRTLIECEATPERRERKEFSWLFSPEFKGCIFQWGKLVDREMLIRRSIYIYISRLCFLIDFIFVFQKNWKISNKVISSRYVVNLIEVDFIRNY